MFVCNSSASGIVALFHEGHTFRDFSQLDPLALHGKRRDDRRGAGRAPDAYLRCLVLLELAAVLRGAGADVGAAADDGRLTDAKSLAHGVTELAKPARRG